jgi:hypothetical protein
MLAAPVIGRSQTKAGSPPLGVSESAGSPEPDADGSPEGAPDAEGGDPDAAGMGLDADGMQAVRTRSVAVRRLQDRDMGVEWYTARHGTMRR